MRLQQVYIRNQELMQQIQMTMDDIASAVGDLAENVTYLPGLIT